MMNKGMNRWFKRLIIPLGCLAFCIAYQVNAYASENSIIGPLNNLYSLFAAVTTAVGSLWTLWNIISLVTAWGQHDPVQQVQGILKLAASLMLIAAPTIVSLISE